MDSKKLNNSSTTSKQYQYSSALMAFIIWGAWAFYVNNTSTHEARVLSGLTQGTASLIITLLIVSLTTKIFNALPDNALRLVFAPLVTMCITGTGLILVHSLVSTPKIIYTVAPAISVAFLFAVFTAVKLKSANTLKDQ